MSIDQFVDRLDRFAKGRDLYYYSVDTPAMVQMTKTSIYFYTVLVSNPKGVCAHPSGMSTSSPCDRVYIPTVCQAP